MAIKRKTINIKKVKLIKPAYTKPTPQKIVSFFTYYDVARLAKIHVKPEDIDDFLFYYEIAEEYGLEIEYLQSILNDLTPVGAANEWDL